MVMVTKYDEHIQNIAIHSINSFVINEKQFLFYNLVM